MIKISDIIVEEGTKDLAVTKTRTTVRAIIIKDGKVLMVYAAKFLDYTFPGGGLKANETHLEGLKRELKEELGANEILSFKPFGYMEEKRFGFSINHSVYHQTSYYYIVEIDELGKQNLVERELEHGVEPRFVSPMDAIKANQMANTTYHHHKGMKTVLPREIKVLEKVIKYMEENQIEKI